MLKYIRQCLTGTSESYFPTNLFLNVSQTMNRLELRLSALILIFNKKNPSKINDNFYPMQFTIRDHAIDRKFHARISSYKKSNTIQLRSQFIHLKITHAYSMTYAKMMLSSIYGSNRKTIYWCTSHHHVINCRFNSVCAQNFILFCYKMCQYCLMKSISIPLKRPS